MGTLGYNLVLRLELTRLPPRHSCFIFALNVVFFCFFFGLKKCKKATVNISTLESAIRDPRVKVSDTDCESNKNSLPSKLLGIRRSC